MKNTAILFSLTLLLFPVIANADPAPTSYECGVNGCDVYCKNEQGQWQTYEHARTSLTTVNHDNGNVEIFINDGVNGNRTLMVSPKNLPCSFKGQQ